MGSVLQGILGGAGNAGNDWAEARRTNQDEKMKMQEFQLRLQQLQQGLAQNKAPQVVHTYRASDGKMHNLVRDPMNGKISDQVSEGSGTQLSPEQQKLADFKQAMGRDATEDEKRILLGAESKTPRNAYSMIRTGSDGKMSGLSAATGLWEKIPEPPGSDFKAPPKTTGGKVNPIIQAQIGKPPDPSAYPKGEDDPLYKAKMKQWGVDAETVQDRMNQQRGIGYNYSRPGAYVTPEGELVTTTAGDAIGKGYVPATPAFNAMSKQAQFQEMQNASGKLRNAITALEPGDAFTADQVAKLKLASESQDEGLFRSVVSNMAAGTTNERQQDYLIWLQQMGERILSLRNVAGMGQGAQDLRAAIQATLPNISSGTKAFALKRLDAVDNQIALLQKGIPKVSGITGNQGGQKVLKYNQATGKLE